MKNEGALDWAPRGFVDTIVALSLQSLEMRNTIAPRCKADGTLVTDADTGLEDRLAEFLLGAEPGSFLIGEETLSTKGHDYLSKALKGKTWVIDPIDGTVLYCMGMDGWGISVGLLENGCMRHGAVAYPKAVPGGAVIGLLASSGEDSVVYGEISVAEGADPRKASADLVAALAPVRRIPPVDG